MKKNFKLVAVLLSMSLMLSSCIGSFNLTNKVKDWNESLGNKFVSELVFIGMHIIPVAVPFRGSLNSIGEAHLTMCRRRPKFVGGSRAIYNGELL